MGQLLRKGVAELFDAMDATIRADIAAKEAKIAADEAEMAVLKAKKAAIKDKIADLLRERERVRGLKARAADPEDRDEVMAATIGERKPSLAVVPSSEPADDPVDVGLAKNADKKPAGYGEK